MRSLIILFLFFSLPVYVLAQTGMDTTRPAADTSLQYDSLTRLPDSLQTAGADTIRPEPVLATETIKNDPALQWRILKDHPWLSFNGPVATREDAEQRKTEGKEWLFYYLVFLFMLFAILKRSFPKYFGDLFRLFFRTTLKQRQIREQLMQTPLPSVLLNGFYVLSAGLYVSFLFTSLRLDPTGNFWTLYLYIVAALSAIYFVKFIILRLSGWLFNIPEAANAYIFVVFIINKMIGILLLPFLLLLAFSGGDLYQVTLSLTWCLVGGLLVYRFILAYGALHNQIKVNPFHFLIYLAAFEAAPVLLIYKALLSYFP